MGASLHYSYNTIKNSDTEFLLWAIPSFTHAGCSGPLSIALYVCIDSGCESSDRRIKPVCDNLQNILTRP